MNHNCKFFWGTYEITAIGFWHLYATCQTYVGMHRLLNFWGFNKNMILIVCEFILLIICSALVNIIGLVCNIFLLKLNINFWFNKEKEHFLFSSWKFNEEKATYLYTEKKEKRTKWSSKIWVIRERRCLPTLLSWKKKLWGKSYLSINKKRRKGIKWSFKNQVIR